MNRRRIEITRFHSRTTVVMREVPDSFWIEVPKPESPETEREKANVELLDIDGCAEEKQDTVERNQKS